MSSLNWEAGAHSYDLGDLGEPQAASYFSELGGARRVQSTRLWIILAEKNHKIILLFEERKVLCYGNYCFYSIFYFVYMNQKKKKPGVETIL